MAIALNKYTKFTLKQYNGSGVDFDTDTIKAALVTSSYTPTQDTDEFFSSVNTYEVSGSGYTAGGSAIANKSVAAAAGVVKFDGDDVVFSENAAGFTNGARVVLYKDTGTASTSPVIAYSDSISPALNNTSGDVTLRWHATDGILKIS